ncbi:hypothetical protein GCM10028807_00390 [Spirosoma daeguense]
MLRCLLLNYPWDGQNPLSYYIQRTGYLTISQAGALTDELLTKLQTESYDFIFLHLSTTDEVLPESFQKTLRQQKRLIVTSPFPRQLFSRLNLNPVAYLTEPYTFDRFLNCVEGLVRQTN